MTRLEEIRERLEIARPRAGEQLILDVGWLLARVGTLEVLLREGHEFSLNNHRAAAVRHRFVAWGDRVEAVLEEPDQLEGVTL
jgi:hypothetical protein